MAASISLSITQNSQSVTNNTSNVTCEVKVHWDNGSWNATGLCTGSITIDGTSYSFSGISFNTSHTTSGSQVIMTKTVNVSHNSDGTKTLSCSASFNTLVSSGVQTASGSKTLTTIARASTIDSVGNTHVNGHCIVTWTPKTTSFRYKLKFVKGNWSHTTDAIHPNQTSSYTYTDYTIPWEVAKHMSSQIDLVTVYLYTYSNSSATTQIGSASSMVFQVTLNEIGKTIITSAPDFTDLDNPKISYSNPVGDAELVKIEAAISNNAETFVIGYKTLSKTGSSYTFSLSAEERNILRNDTTTRSQPVFFVVRTTIGNIVWYSFANVTLTIAESDATKPTVSMTLSPSSTLKAPYNSLYLQGHSKVKATLSFDTKHNATVSASTITVAGVNYSSPYESGILSKKGTVSVKATVKDSRGYYGTNNKAITVIPYSQPYVSAKSGESSIIAARCDSSANFIDSGTYLKIKAKAVYSKVISNGVQNNYGKLKFRYRKEGGSYSAWQTILDCKTDNSDEVITPPLLNGAMDAKYNYQVQIIASDDLYDSVPVTIAVPSEDVYMDRPAGGKSMGLGGYSTGDGSLDIYWKTKARGGLSLFDSKGDEIPLESTMPVPRDQLKGNYDPNNLDCGIYAVTDSSPLKSGDTVIMYNGILMQMKGTVGDHVKFQLTLPVDSNKSPMYRVNWYSNWSDWRSMKL